MAWQSGPAQGKHRVWEEHRTQGPGQVSPPERGYMSTQTPAAGKSARKQVRLSRMKRRAKPTLSPCAPRRSTISAHRPSEAEQHRLSQLLTVKDTGQREGRSLPVSAVWTVNFITSGDSKLYRFLWERCSNSPGRCPLSQSIQNRTQDHCRHS